MRRVRNVAVPLALAAWAAVAAAQEAPAAPQAAATVFHQDVAWSPDGSRLAFSELADSGDYRPENWGLHVVEVATGERRQVATAALWVTWSADGARLAFGSGRDGNWEIYSVAADGGDLRRLTDHPAKDHIPAWSPAGDRIAFCSDRDGNEEIYVMDADGANPRRLTEHPANDYNPAWSPDGAHLVFYRESGDGKDQIRVIAADGSGERAITDDDANNVFPAFTPDGDILFSTSRDDESAVVRVAADGSGRSVVPVTGFFARVAPDGRRIAYISGRWPASAIHVLEADGTVRRLVE